MNAEFVFASSIAVLLLFCFAWYASRPEPMSQPVEELNPLIGDFFVVGFIVTYALWFFMGQP